MACTLGPRPGHPPPWGAVSAFHNHKPSGTGVRLTPATIVPRPLLSSMGGGGRPVGAAAAAAALRPQRLKRVRNCLLVPVSCWPAPPPGQWPEVRSLPLWSERPWVLATGSKLPSQPGGTGAGPGPGPGLICASLRRPSCQRPDLPCRPCTCAPLGQPGVCYQGAEPGAGRRPRRGRQRCSRPLHQRLRVNH